MVRDRWFKLCVFFNVPACMVFGSRLADPGMARDKAAKLLIGMIVWLIASYVTAIIADERNDRGRRG